VPSSKITQEWDYLWSFVRNNLLNVNTIYYLLIRIHMLQNIIVIICMLYDVYESVNVFDIFGVRITSIGI
jgi:hypothetical protein